MTIEVFPVKGPVTSGSDSYPDVRSDADVAEDLRQIYERVSLASGAVVGTHVFKVYNNLYTDEVRGETHFIVADIPPVHNGNDAEM